MKDDPRYVKYVVRLFGRKDGVSYENFIPYHKCTDADWEDFYPPSTSGVDGWNTIRSDPKRGFYCLDWSGDYDLYGNEITNNYQKIEFVLAPCNYVHSYLGWQGDSINPDCIADLDK